MVDPRTCIAVIDDDASMREALARLLRASGYDVATHASAETFLDDSARHRAALAVVDVQLRGLSGLELLERLRGEASATPVAFITAHDEPGLRARGLAAGAVAWLRKPFPGRALLAAIEAALAACPPASPSTPTRSSVSIHRTP